MEKVKISKKQAEVIKSILAKKVKGYSWAIDNKKGDSRKMNARKKRLENVIAKLPNRAKNVSILKKECEIVAKVLENKMKGYTWALSSESVETDVKSKIKQRAEIVGNLVSILSPTKNE